ncbi:MAG: molecular chaperone TorD family protein [Oscillatoria sp. Prado101]|nr:molecular chaperone TorD family protein [Oscillatoria sp. Prado101]
MLEYPSPGIREKASECCHRLAIDYPEASEKVRSFWKFADSTPASLLEEIYTGTFDLNPVCFPYPGYHLFGESYKRGEFLAKLKQKYRECGFTEESSELADHLTVLLGFIASIPPEDILAQELIEDCLVPALHKMNEGFKEGNPYAEVLQALLGVLEGMRQTAPV